jgi:hypothetical protein
MFSLVGLNERMRTVSLMAERFYLASLFRSCEKRIVTRADFEMSEIVALRVLFTLSALFSFSRGRNIPLA